MGYLAMTFVLLGDYDAGVAAADRALAIAEAVGDPHLPIQANAYLGLIFCEFGDYRAATTACRRVVDRIEPELLRERLGAAFSPFTAAWGTLAICCAETGQFAEGLSCSAEAVRVTEVAVAMQPFNRIFAEVSAGWVHLRKGELDPAVRVLDHALTLCEAAGIRLMVVSAAALLGYAHALAGRLPDALVLLERGVRDSHAMKLVPRRALSLAHLGEAYLLAGRREEAREQARQALELHQAHGERGWRAYTLRLLGEIAAQGAPPDIETAEGWYRQAVDVAQDCGMRPLVAHCHLGLGKLYRRTGRRELTHEHLTTATTMYREMDMRFWLEKAEAEIRAL